MHKHEIAHRPQNPSGCGYAVCECGATLRIENGCSVGEWHACSLCVVGAPPPSWMAGRLKIRPITGGTN